MVQERTCAESYHREADRRLLRVQAPFISAHTLVFSKTSIPGPERLCTFQLPGKIMRATKVFSVPENTWVSEFGWNPTGITGDGRCGHKCESGSFRTDTGRYRHDKVLSGATSTGHTCSGIEQQKDAVPPMLLDEILSAVESQRTDSKRTWIVDLFAGYGSLRAVGKAQGLNYLAIDMRDLMSATKESAATGKE